MATYLPIVRLVWGKYLIGTHEKQVEVKEDGPIVRTGGGFMKLDEYLKHYSKSECIELSSMMRKGDGSYKNTVLSLLKSHKSEKWSVTRWERKCKPEMTE